jgi:hypothetical protein
MSLGNFRSGRFELLVCLAGPLLVLAAVAIPGHLYRRDLREDVRNRHVWLDRLPELERQLAEVKTVLNPFLTGAEGERSAALTLSADQAVALSGFKAHSVNVEKQPGTDGSSWSDYSVAMNGSGTLITFVRMLDYLGDPARQLRVAQLTLKAREFTPELVYDGDMVLVSRAVTPPVDFGGAGNVARVTLAQSDTLMERAKQRVGSVQAWAMRKPTPLDTKLLEGRVRSVNVAEPAAPPEDGAVFRLRGIVQRKQKPLAMTDSGVFGVGDEVNGFKIVSIEEDRVVLLHKSGRRETVNLYADEVQ